MFYHYYFSTSIPNTLSGRSHTKKKGQREKEEEEEEKKNRAGDTETEQDKVCADVNLLREHTSINMKTTYY
jgi:hypothetical protein